MYYDGMMKAGSPVQGDDDEDESRSVEAEYPEEDPGHDDD